MKTEKFKDLFKYAPKSNLKASYGNEEGNFAFYTSSSRISKRTDKAQYYDEALIFGNGGSANIHYSNEPFSTTSHCFVAVPKILDINPKYVYYYLSGNIHLLERGFKGAGLKNISPKYIENLDIPILSIVTQNKIVAVLDKAASLLAKRQNCLDLIDNFLHSTFNKMFGDIVNNPKNWPTKSIEKSVLIIKDGPFGSNLKTEHYAETGVRIIRLQNIGVNKFNNENKKYVLESHAEVLKKHTCLSGDILVGTLGVPNLRACKFPSHIDKAINKADCIQIRPNTSIAIDSYLIHLLNHNGTLFLVSNYIKGQTRSRVSKGMLSKIKIPIPPIELQKQFEKIELKLDFIKEKLLGPDLNNLYKSIIQKVFNGELNFNVDFELDALIQEIDLQKKENNLSKIVGDISYLQRLIDKLNTKEFIKKEMYDKAKHAVFQLMSANEEERKVTQEYDLKTKSIKLTVI